MTEQAPPESLGRDLRVLRKRRGMTLVDVAGRVERSVGWLSQVERDISEPSIEELAALATVLGTPVSTFFGRTPARPGEEGRIVRKDARRPIVRRVRGLVEELLSPDLTDTFEVVHSTFAPGASRSATTRPTQEVGYIVSGELEVTIAGCSFSLAPGDSFRIRGETYSWANRTSEPCIAVWVIAPPVY